MEDRSHEDVVMGGGLETLPLAVQLERRDPGIDVLVAERSYAAMLADPLDPRSGQEQPADPGRPEEDRSGGAGAGPGRGGPRRHPAKVIDPQAKVALLHTRRLSEQMVLRLLAHNVEHWLSYEVMR